MLLPIAKCPEIWTAIQSLWALVYVGPPAHLTADQESSYISPEMRYNLEGNHVNLQEVSILHPGSLGTVEKYYEPLRAAFPKLLFELGRGALDKLCL